MRASRSLILASRLLVALQILCQVGLLGLAGCSKRYSDLPVFSALPIKDYDNESVGRFKTSYLVEQIDNYYRGTNPGPIGVTTFVNLDDLYSTSSFGRMLGEQVMSELAMKGFDVVELRHSDALQFLASDGEFALSRDIRSVRHERDLGGVVVGTYVASPVRVYLNARLIDPSSSMVLSAGSVEMEKTKEIARMLRGGAFPATLERIPVKHLGLSTYPMNLWAPSAYSAYQAEESGPTPPAPGFLPEARGLGKGAGSWTQPQLGQGK
ncbi:MAG: hypothetical protein K1X83_05760 [Oligoflexia bacterium]|nr:hypothetical protein [Oligoflexia bacterium]